MYLRALAAALAFLAIATEAKLRGGATSTTYEVFEHSGIEGNRIGERVYTSDIKECAKACSKHFDCVGFVEAYDASPAYCVLKSSSFTQHDQLNKRVHLKPTGVAAGAHEKEGTYEVYSNSAIPGDDIDAIRIYYERAHGVDECVKACDDLESCVAVVDHFHEKKPYCVLKEATKGLYRRSTQRVLMRPESSASADVAGYRAFEDRAIEGSKLGERIYYGEKGVEACVEACDALEDCAAIVDVHSGGAAKDGAYCVLKSESRRMYRSRSAGKRVLLRPEGRQHDPETRRVRILRETRELASDDDAYSAYSAEAREYEYFVLQGFAIPSYGIGSRVYYNTLQDCSEACDADDECVAFVDNYARSSPYCVLKKSSSSSSVTIGVEERDSKNVHVKKSAAAAAALSVTWASPA